ncbi:MAG TPA: sulfotransferase [Solirubrobacteraceae bacterium]
MTGSAGRLPDFFVVGHPKSGTTALYEMLRRHPQIHMGDLKEPWFFATDLSPRFKHPASGVSPRSLEEYAALFEGAAPDQRIGEGTSSYLMSHTAARAIAEVRPQARIIAILREPVSFLRSLHLQLLQNHIESKQDLRRALELEAARREGRHIPRRSDRPQLLQYLDHVHYVEQLERYREVFASDQMLVLIYDDFRNANEETIRTVLGFLDVDDSVPIDVLEVNPSVRTRSQQLDNLVHALSVGHGPVSRAAKGAIKVITPRRLRLDALTLTRERIVNATPRPPDDVLVAELRRRFSGEVSALSEYLGRDLVSLWGYEDAG